MQSSDLLPFIRLVVDGDIDEVRNQLARNPDLASMSMTQGATRTNAKPFFFESIRHYVYAGDTALHMAAATFHHPIARLLVKSGADPHARNRRGAQPLHYAADANHWNPKDQARVIAYLLSAGADPNAVDKTGVAPLHRAVRSRSEPAVRTLLEGGADPRLQNGSGSTPLHLAVQTTGKSGSGTESARQQQAAIIRLLIDRGARTTDKDAKGKTILAAATSHWARASLRASK